MSKKTLLEEQWIAEGGIVKVAVSDGQNDAELIADCFGNDSIARIMAAANNMLSALRIFDGADWACTCDYELGHSGEHSNECALTLVRTAISAAE